MVEGVEERPCGGQQEGRQDQRYPHQQRRKSNHDIVVVRPLPLLVCHKVNTSFAMLEIEYLFFTIFLGSILNPLALAHPSLD